MKVNLRKVKPLVFENSNIKAVVNDYGRDFLRDISIRHKWSNNYICGFYHEDALKLRDWLSKALGDK